MTGQSWCWLPTLLWTSMYTLASARPSKKPNPTLPRALPGCWLLCPKGSASNFCHSERQIKWQQILYLWAFIFIWSLGAVCKPSRFRQAANAPWHHQAGASQMHAVWCCLLDSFISFCYNSCILSEILWDGAYPWAGKPYQNTEAEMEIQKSPQETSASCTCSSWRASLQTPGNKKLQSSTWPLSEHHQNTGSACPRVRPSLLGPGTTAKTFLKCRWLAKCSLGPASLRNSNR